jgi:tRNA-splicing ligase RtcB
MRRRRVRQHSGHHQRRKEQLVTYSVLPADKPVRVWTDLAGVDPAALDQLRNIAALDQVVGVAVMPDVHLGKGATVGSVIAMRDALSPSAVGVDIGCGMSAIKTNLTASDLPDDLGRLRRKVEAVIPVGFAAHDHVSAAVDRLDLWKRFDDLTSKVADLAGRARAQLGTLGGGNHFVELCLDTTDGVWLMLHSGSRNIGKVLAEHHIGVAKSLPHNADLPDRDLAVFLAGTPEMEAYVHDLYWAQDYARLNRSTMLTAYKAVLREMFPQVSFEKDISCHHNYVAHENHFGRDLVVTRKGAIRAAAGDLGVIPGSMGTRSYIVRGLGNADAYTSASHGAGRRMSRSAARRQFTVADLVAQTAGVECRKDDGVIDEIPAAYKDIDQVMADQADLVEVVVALRQVMCIKG